ncbi:hypothetical protein GCM10020001_021100 [Nonomuraea salmonea]
MAAHPGVDMVSFTGSTAAGRRVAALAAETVKRVALELGGKSANLILPDADLPLAVKVGVANCFVNAGQTCSAWTRMLVQRDQYDEAVGLAVELARGYRVGDPFDESTKIGPLVSAAQRDRVTRYVNRGQEEGARLVAGGTERPYERGYYVEPTVFAAVEPGMTIEQEEIFGPVLSLIPYFDENDAVKIANGTPYGLAGAVWAGTDERALDVARRLRTGQVAVNGGRFNPMAPPSAATNSRASAASWASTAWRSSWRSSHCSSRRPGRPWPGCSGRSPTARRGRPGTRPRPRCRRACPAAPARSWRASAPAPPAGWRHAACRCRWRRTRPR